MPEVEYDLLRDLDPTKTGLRYVGLGEVSGLGAHWVAGEEGIGHIFSHGRILAIAGNGTVYAQCDQQPKMCNEIMAVKRASQL